MKLYFNDNSYIDVNVIFGELKLIDGIERDVLSIELSKDNNIDELNEIFSDKNKTIKLYHYCNDKGTEVKQYIGEGYCILLSIENINRKIKHIPGFIHKDEYEDVIIVNLAQFTYDEYHEYLGDLE